MLKTKFGFVVGALVVLLIGVAVGFVAAGKQELVNSPAKIYTVKVTKTFQDLKTSGLIGVLDFPLGAEVLSGFAIVTQQFATTPVTSGLNMIAELDGNCQTGVSQLGRDFVVNGTMDSTAGMVPPDNIPQLIIGGNFCDSASMLKLFLDGNPDLVAGQLDIVATYIIH